MSIYGTAYCSAKKAAKITASQTHVKKQFKIISVNWKLKSVAI